MRSDVEFDADGTTLRGWLYVPDGAAGPVPTVVMSHGFSAVKEMYLDRFAEAFAAAGLGALVYDNRNFGASDGEPRQEIDPWEQVRDYRNAITYAQTRAEVDADRIGVWGSSYSGGHVLVVGAIDRRVKCVACQVPLISGHENARRIVRCRLHRARRRDVRRRPRGPLRGRAAGDDPGRRRGPDGPVGASDGRLVRVVHGDRRVAGALVAQRGDAAQRRDVLGVRARAPTSPGSRPRRS